MLKSFKRVLSRLKCRTEKSFVSKHNVFLFRLLIYSLLLLLIYVTNTTYEWQQTDKLKEKSSITSPNPTHSSTVPCLISDSGEESTEPIDSAFSPSQLPYQPLCSSASCEPQIREARPSPLASSFSVSDMPQNVPPPPPPPNARGKRGRGVPRGASSVRSRPHRNVSSTRSHSSSQLIRPKVSSSNSPFNLESLLTLNPFPGLPMTTPPDNNDVSSPLQRKLDERAVFQ